MSDEIYIVYNVGSMVVFLWMVKVVILTFWHMKMTEKLRDCKVLKIKGMKVMLQKGHDCVVIEVLLQCNQALIAMQFGHDCEVIE